MEFPSSPSLSSYMTLEDHCETSANPLILPSSTNSHNFEAVHFLHQETIKRKNRQESWSSIGRGYCRRYFEVKQTALTVSQLSITENYTDFLVTPIRSPSGPHHLPPFTPHRQLSRCPRPPLQLHTRRVLPHHLLSVLYLGNPRILESPERSVASSWTRIQMEMTSHSQSRLPSGGC
jgi:hypothetical protein